ncbi:MAG: hypothetical protein N3A58_02955 [Spirochaetes bacterium]|nr:hypothetical protein [Spirochaetota bacterium]
MYIAFYLCASYEELFLEYLKYRFGQNLYKKVLYSRSGLILLELEKDSKIIDIIKSKEYDGFIFPYMTFIDLKVLSIPKNKNFDYDPYYKFEKSTLLCDLCNEFLLFIKGKKLDENIFFLFLKINNLEINNLNNNKNKKVSLRLKKFEILIKEFLKKKISRVVKKFVSDFNQLEYNDFYDFRRERVCFLSILSEDRCFYSFYCFYNGQKRMIFDNKSPSRSYLKLEEAFKIFCKKPGTYNIVFDLGASPGGWTYSCFKKGAIVYSIDNGELRSNILRDEIKKGNIFHIKNDAFKFVPDSKDYNYKLSWFLCDIIEKPEKIAKLAMKWITNRWAYFYIINFKIGFSNFENLFLELKKLEFEKNFSEYRFIHLFSDREEITFLGILK